jgi:hypothetical protein
MDSNDNSSAKKLIRQLKKENKKLKKKLNVCQKNLNLCKLLIPRLQRVNEGYKAYIRENVSSSNFVNDRLQGDDNEITIAKTVVTKQKKYDDNSSCNNNNNIRVESESNHYQHSNTKVANDRTNTYNQRNRNYHDMQINDDTSASINNDENDYNNNNAENQLKLQQLQSEEFDIQTSLQYDEYEEDGSSPSSAISSPSVINDDNGDINSNDSFQIKTNIYDRDNSSIIVNKSSLKRKTDYSDRYASSINVTMKDSNDDDYTYNNNNNNSSIDGGYKKQKLNIKNTPQTHTSIYANKNQNRPRKNVQNNVNNKFDKHNVHPKSKKQEPQHYHKHYQTMRNETPPGIWSLSPV